MFAKVIPFTKLPRKFGGFDYSVPRELETKIKIGHIVAIYFHGQKIYGVISDLSAEPQIETDKIKPLISLTKIILPETLLRLIAWAAENYLVAPSLLYKIIIPHPVKKENALRLAPKKKVLSLNNFQAQNVIKILGNLAPDKHKFFLHENDFKETLAAFIKIAQKKLAREKQVLLLAPSPEDINIFAPYLSSVFGDKLIVWQGKMAKGERFSKWLAILDGRPAVILGTRPACFLPFKNLSAILIYNCTSPDLKQWDQNPRYDSREAAEKLQEIYQTRQNFSSQNLGGQTILVFSDILPDLKNFKDLRDEKTFALNEANSPPPFTIVDVKKEKKSVPFFSFPVYQMAEEGLAKKQKIILFINRKEKNSLLFCSDCRKTFSCSECGRPLNVDNGQFLCYHCGRKTEMPTECPDCRGTNLKTFAAGTENIKKIISKEFPEAKIEIAAENKISVPDFDILITTDYFWKNVLPKMAGAEIYGAALLDFDFYLAKPEFNQKETALLALYRFLNFAKIYKLKEVLVQTAFPENDLFGRAETFYNKELEEREEGGYPPFQKLIKIICKAGNKDILERESQALYGKLLNSGFNALPPFAPYVKKRTKNYLKHLILKESLNKNLSELKNIVPDEYQIDINPIAIY